MQRIMNDKFMQIAIDKAKEGLGKVGFGPFGACIVKDGELISTANNRVVQNNDPTAHAEILAIREASRKLETFDLRGCEIYSTCEPCPMCLAAIYWARIDKLYFGANRKDAAEIKFDDEFFYNELQKPLEKRSIQTTSDMMREECLKLFRLWEEKEDKVMY